MDNNREEEVGEEMHRGELGSEHAPRPAAPPRLVAHPRSQPWSSFSTSSSSTFPSMEVSLPFFTFEEKGSSQQVELKDEGGAVGGGADRQFERSSVNFSSQRPK